MEIVAQNAKQRKYVTESIIKNGYQYEQVHTQAERGTVISDMHSHIWLPCKQSLTAKKKKKINV